MDLLSLTLVLVPTEITQWYLDRLYSRLLRLRAKREEAFKTLDSIDEDLDHTEGFRNHLVDKVNRIDSECRELKRSIQALELIVDKNI